MRGSTGKKFLEKQKNRTSLLIQNLFLRQARESRSRKERKVWCHDVPSQRDVVLVEDIDSKRMEKKSLLKTSIFNQDQLTGKPKDGVPHMWIEIGIASPEQIRKWAERKLSTGVVVGRVENPDTVEYRTHTPIKGGLFCERLFGPIVDKTCSCGRCSPRGKSLPPKITRMEGEVFVCPICEVEPTSSSMRRVQLGFIQLFSAVTHPWYWRGQPSYITDFLSIHEDPKKSKKWIENIINCTTFLIESERVKEDGMLLALGEEEPVWSLVEKILASRLTQGEARFARPSLLSLRERSETKSDSLGSLRSRSERTRLSEPEIQGDTESLSQSEKRVRSSLRSREATPAVIREGRKGITFSEAKDGAMSSSQELLDRSLVDSEFASSEEILSQRDPSLASDLLEGEARARSPLRETFGEARFARPSLRSFRERSEGKLSNERRKIYKKIVYKGRVYKVYKGEVYNRSHTFPASPFFTCSSIDREDFFGYMAEPATGEDRPNLHYCQLDKLPLKSNFSDILTIYPMNRQQAAQEVLCHTGGDAIRYLLSKLDLTVLKQHLKIIIPKMTQDVEGENFQIRGYKRSLKEQTNSFSKEDRDKIRLMEKKGKEVKKELNLEQKLSLRRLKMIRSYIKAGKRPEWMVLSNLPVLPPGLRPIIRTPDGIIATSDLNRLYRTILFANKSLERLSILNVNTLCLSKRSLQDAVEALIENGRGDGKRAMDHNTGQPLKSLSASLKGKKGRFRHHLLGKRVDYSGRSVIIVGPTLQLQQCGLPREMAIELFSPFLIRYLLLQNFAPTVATAKQYIARNQRLLWGILEQVIKHHPVLLNRAPTLHRLGIQAFQPTLVLGRAIHLHPLVCAGFNADFDGDQMGVHIPLSFQARAEAWRLLWSANHILSPATGQPNLVPSQDMVLGCYYLTSFDRTRFSRQGVSSSPLLAQREGQPLVSRASTKVSPLLAQREARFALAQREAIPSVREATPSVKRSGQSESDTFGDTRRGQREQVLYFANVGDALGAFANQHMALHTPLWLRFAGIFESPTNSEEPVEIRIHSNGRRVLIRSEVQQITAKSGKKRNLVGRYIRTTAGRIWMHHITMPV